MTKKLKKYRIQALVTISVHTEVEAKSGKEAGEIALADRSMISLCHQCGGGDPTQEWCTSGELDGEPMKLRAMVIE